MGRFYDRRIVEDEGVLRYFVTIDLSTYAQREVEVPREVYELLDEMQREFWRLEKREARHSWHIEDMYESDLPHERMVETPEQLMMRKIEEEELRTALWSLPEVQRRRFLLHHLEGIPVKSLARMEGCSDRAIKYSLAIARKNLRKALED